LKPCIIGVSLLCGVTTFVFSAVFIAPDGSDTNPGTVQEPLESIQKAQSMVSAGDTVLIRGGIYRVRTDQISHIEQNLFACISYLNKSGQTGKMIHYWAYAGETPVFDFSEIKPTNQRVVGIWVSGSYIYIKGLEMTGVQVTITSHTESYCIYSWGNHNIFELISMHHNKGTGLRHRRGGCNLFLNCDAYLNHDDVSEDKKGSNTDGFGCHPTAGGTGNVFRGCRAWFNSDDGYDIIRSSEPVVFDSCWAFYNGYSESFSSLGDGNGFKAGGYAYDDAGQIPSPVPRNTIRFCLAVNNKANGFYSNHHLAGNDWINNSAFRNSINYNMVNRESAFSDNINVDGYDHLLINNLGYRARARETAYIDEALCTLANNSFDLDTEIADEDFISLDETLLSAPRKPDGSLPDIDFMHPAQASLLVDAGVDVGFPFVSVAPDLGAFESGTPVQAVNLNPVMPAEMILFPAAPNPFNPSTSLYYFLQNPGWITIKILNTRGITVETLAERFESAGYHQLQWQPDRPVSGIYLCQLISGRSAATKKLVLVK
jgi:hypothetical protein